jgi:sorbitol-specific phosphotransferase system component IIC
MWKHILTALSLVPQIVVGIEMVHGGVMSGEDKKTLAMKSLGLAYSATSAILPEHREAIDVATKLASDMIDGTVAFLNATKQMPTPVTEISPSVS